MPDTNDNTIATSAGTLVSYTTKPVYEKVALLGKTVESAGFAGTADREKIKRTYVTLDAGFDGSQIIVHGTDEIGIRSVTAATLEVSVAFIGDTAAHIPATWKLHGYKADSVENEDAVDLFVGEESADKLAALLRTADAVSANKPEFAGLWKVVDVASGKRVFIRAIAPVDARGNVCC